MKDIEDRKDGRSARAIFTVESLETRTLMSAAIQTALPHIMAPAAIVQPGGGLGPIVGLTPLQLERAYGFDKLYARFKNEPRFRSLFQNLGTGQTIAVVCIGHDPTLQADLDLFSSTFGLGTASLTVNTQFTVPNGNIIVNPNGADVAPAMAHNEAMIVEWIHALVPLASIHVEETPLEFQAVGAAAKQKQDYFAGIARASAAVKGKGDVVVCANGSAESDPAFFPGTAKDDLKLESLFTNPANQSISYIAPASPEDDSDTYFEPGDDLTNENDALSYPGSSPNVLAVGGTTLNTTSNGTRVSESPWVLADTPFENDDGAGGFSSIFVQPPYQAGVTVNKVPLANLDPFAVSTPSGRIVHRAGPDVSFLSDPATGVAVLDTTGAAGWEQMAGGGLARLPGA